MKLTNGLDDLAHRRALKRWSRIATSARGLDAFSLRTLRGQARALRDRLEQVIAIADRIDADVPHQLGWPDGEWVWRPGIWDAPKQPDALIEPDTGAVLCNDLKLFHDCTFPSLTLRQTAGSYARPGAVLEVYDFDGSFLSLVLDIPPEGTRDLARHHILRLALAVKTERPQQILARLNLRQGPNTTQIVLEPELAETHLRFEFDLAYSDASDTPVDSAWIDLIFDNPAMNRIDIFDLILARIGRAEI